MPPTARNGAIVSTKATRPRNRECIASFSQSPLARHYPAHLARRTCTPTMVPPTMSDSTTRISGDIIGLATSLPSGCPATIRSCGQISRQSSPVGCGAEPGGMSSRGLVLPQRHIRGVAFTTAAHERITRRAYRGSGAAPAAVASQRCRLRTLCRALQRRRVGLREIADYVKYDMRR